MEQFVEKHFELCTEIKTKCLIAFMDQFERGILNHTLEICHDIKMARILRIELQQAKQGIFEKNQLKYVTQVDYLIAELQIRFRSLSKKYSVELEDLSDYQVVDIQQDKSMDQELNAILGKATGLASNPPLAGERIVNLVGKIRRTRDKLCPNESSFAII